MTLTNIQAHILGKRHAGSYLGIIGLQDQVSVACSTDMTLFGYDQGVFGMSGARTKHVALPLLR